MINKTQLNRLRTHIDKNKEYLDSIDYNGDDDKKYSVALTMATLMDYLGVNQINALDSVTDGGSDNKFDGFYFNDDEDELSDLIIIQSKYKREDGATGAFDEDEIKLCISNCKAFLQGENFQSTNQVLASKIDKYRQLLIDNGLPAISIKLFFATNGIIHEGHKVLNEVMDGETDNIYSTFVDATKYGETQELKNGVLKVNLKNDLDKTDNIFNIGDNQYAGRVISCNTKELMLFFQETGETILLNQNVRYKLKKSTVNKDIHQSFIADPSRFCYLNNGITIICDDFYLSPTGHNTTRVDLIKPSIINGGQTISTLFEIYKKNEHESHFDSSNILLRIYKVPNSYKLNIAKATNSQNPISVVDLHANDDSQKLVKDYFSTRGIGLIIKIGEDTTFYDDIITNENLLQLYAAIFKDDPAKAKLSKRNIFNRYFDTVFGSSTNSETCKKLYRSYTLKRYLDQNNSIEKSLKSNGFYSFIFCMKGVNNNIKNINIPDNQMTQHFDQALSITLPLINEIVTEKQALLGTKFSLNNLFKGNEIKDLIDIKIAGL